MSYMKDMQMTWKKKYCHQAFDDVLFQSTESNQNHSTFKERFQLELSDGRRTIFDPIVLICTISL